MTRDFDRVTLSDVSRHFGRRRAVWKVTLAIRTGEIVGLLGPNGAGKSTLLGLLATVISPTSGRIEYGGQSAAADGLALRRRIGLLAHELHLYPELSARQNLTFTAKLHGLGAAAVDRALAESRLQDRADEPVSSFSRGMRQRLALERALVHEPRLMLLDEPFTGLDDRGVAAVAARVRKLAATGSLVVLATHDLEVADGLVTRVVVMRGGSLVADETATPGLRARYRGLVGAA